MIIYTKGDIFTSNCGALVNPVNQVGVMGGGLARAFKERYPEVFDAYKQFTEGGGWESGIYVRVMSGGKPQTVQICLHFCVANDGKMIINLPTKDHWARPSRLDMVEQAIIDLAYFCNARNLENVAVPRLGCGLGGLKWSDVNPLIISHLGQIRTSVEVWSL